MAPVQHFLTKLGVFRYQQFASIQQQNGRHCCHWHLQAFRYAVVNFQHAFRLRYCLRKHDARSEISGILQQFASNCCRQRITQQNHSNITTIFKQIASARNACCVGF